MRHELTWMVGGQQGEGIESTGEVLASGLNRAGYHLYGYRTFSSRIKGGHTNFKIRIAGRRVLGMTDTTDVLVAFDQEALDRVAYQLADDAVILFDSDGSKQARIPEGKGWRVFSLPMSRTARELGAVIMKNMVGVGASAALLGLPPEPFEAVIHDRFARKGERMVEANRRAFAAGYELARQAAGAVDGCLLAPGDGRQRYLMSGDEAVAFGALAAGCRVMAAYPITPASEIMHWLVQKLPRFGGVVVQAEDEIAAITLAIGAAYAGARAMTATSGPGFSLMMEALGYAGMIEVPVVIVDVQRAGPSTGMPTKHEQSDLFEILYGSHGDLPRIVLAPSTVEEAFALTVEAFNLAERYQTPVVLALDLALGLCEQTVEGLDLDRVVIDRGQVVTQEELNALQGAPFKRYAVTESGVSPRSLPGMRGGLYLATGVEHDETGHITEDRRNRLRMVQKRLRKIAGVHVDGLALDYAGPEKPEVLLVGWGSPNGPIAEARELLEREGVSVGHARVRLLSPFPAEALGRLIAAADKVVVVENNAQGQLARLIRQEIDAADKRKLRSVLKYDGTPFVAREIVAQCREVL